MSRLVAKVVAATASLTLAALETSTTAQFGVDKVVVVQQFVKSAFPELAGMDLAAHVSFDIPFDAPDWTARDRNLAVGIAVTPWGQPGEEASMDTRPLHGLLEITPDGEIPSAVFGGSHLHSADMKVLRDRLRQHPGWQESDVQAAIRSAGGQYGPADKAAFVQNLNLSRFSPWVGDIMHIGDIALEWTDNGVEPLWFVSVEVERQNSTACYAFGFEPLTGRLTVMTKRRCQ